MPFLTLQTTQADYIAHLKAQAGAGRYPREYIAAIEALSPAQWEAERARRVAYHSKCAAEAAGKQLSYRLLMPGRVAPIEIDTEVLKNLCQLAITGAASIGYHPPKNGPWLTYDDDNLRAIELAQMILGGDDSLTIPEPLG